MLVPFTDPRVAWLLPRTKPKQEHNVVQVLHHRALETYCRHVLDPRGRARAPVGPVALFPSKVFARREERSQYTTANYGPGVLGVVQFNEFLPAVEGECVDFLKACEGERGNLAACGVRMRSVRGQRARMLAGPFAGYEGFGREIHAGRRSGPAVADVGRWGKASRGRGSPEHQMCVAATS